MLTMTDDRFGPALSAADEGLLLERAGGCGGCFCSMGHRSFDPACSTSMQVTAAETGGAGALPVWTNDQIATFLAVGFWEGAAHSFDVAPGGTITVNLTALAPEAQFLAREALNLWTDVTGIKFAEVTSGQQILFTSDQPGAYASVSYSGANTVSATVNVSTDWVARYGTGLKTYSFQTYIHEIGHALGLGHGGAYNGSADYPANALYANDSWATTVMSYFSQRENGYFAGQGFTAQLVGTPMAADAIATELLYGAATTTRLGDTRYGFGNDSGRAVYDPALIGSMTVTIYDDGGIDTLDLSGFGQAQRIDLNSEAFSNVGGRIGNLTIARGDTIENAVSGSGADVLIGNAAANRLSGGAGNDYYVVDGLDQVIEAIGAGFDIVAATMNFTLGTASEVEQLIAAVAEAFTALDLFGNEFGQTIVGSAGNNLLRGNGGADTLVGLGGDDDLQGEDGEDSLDGGFGRDRLAGGAGRDTLFGRAEGDVLAGGGDGDLLFGDTGEDELRGDDGEDYLDGGSDRDVIHGDAGRDDLRGGSGNDTLVGGTEGDLLFGEDGEDELAGGLGDDYLTGGAGRDYAFGEDGQDTLYGGLEGDVLFGGAGADFVFGEDGEDYLDGGAGADVLFGDTGRDTIRGGDEADALIGGVDGDLLFGDAGNDALEGDSGDDYLEGGDGDDSLLGGTGADTIVGGAGADRFVFQFAGDSGFGGAPDYLGDFDAAGGDRIDLSQIDAVAGTADNDGFTFVGTSAFSNKAGELRYELVEGRVHVFGDIDGDGAADLAFVVNTAAIQAGDFIL